jgi:hypothetical protein
MTLALSLQFLFNARDFVFQGLGTVSASSDMNNRTDPRCAHGVHCFVATFNRREDLIPFSLDVGTVGVQTDGQSGFTENPLTSGHILGQRDTNTQRYYTEIGDDFDGYAS